MLSNDTFILTHLTAQARWCQGHGAIVGTTTLGFGWVHYALVRAFRCKVCAVLGSGGGFVPRMLRQAQRDEDVEDSRTILVDVDGGKWGRPDWTAPDSFFRVNWPEIEWWKLSTIDAAEKFKPGSIDFLHVDADHSRAHSDFDLYASKIRVGGIVTIHDTVTGGGCTAGLVVERIRKLQDWDIVGFPGVGAGVALARKRA